MSEMNNLLDLNQVYMKEVFKPQLGKETKKEAPKSESKPEAKSNDGGGKDKKEASSDKRVRQAVYDIRYRARREEIPLSKAYTQYLQNTTMSGPEKSAVKAKLGEQVDFEEEVTQTKYQVRVKDKNSGKSYTRMATREKINQLRANPNIASVEMTKYGTPYEGEKKKGEQTAATKSGKGLDPVGQEDKDIDNDGDHDKSDKYLLKRRKAIGKAIATRKEEVAFEAVKHATAKQMHSPHEVPSKDLKKLVKKAVKRIDTDVDGDTDNNDKAKGELGEFIPGVGNKRLYSTTKTITAKESFSNWRTELFEVDEKDANDIPQIKEKKVKNTVKINPELKESIEEIGGTLLEAVEIEEIDYLINGVYDELLDEGYEDDDIENAIEYALTEATVTFGHDTEREPRMRDKLKSKAKEYLAKAMVKGYNKARDLKRQAEPHMQRAKTSLKRGIRKAAMKVADRMKEEVEQVDEGLSGDRYKAALKKGKQYSRRVSADPEKRATRGGRGGESDFGAGDRGAGNKAARRAGTYQEEVEQIDEISAQLALTASQKADNERRKAAVAGDKERAMEKARQASALYKGVGPRRAKERMKEDIEINEDEYRRMLAKERQAERESEKEFRTKGGIGDKKKGPKLSSTKKSTVAGKDYADSQMGSIKIHDKASKGKHTIGSPFTEETIDEKMNLAKADMGDVVKDFYKSDAPQFKGRSKEERRKMAIAAKLTAERGGRKLGEQQEEKPTQTTSAQPAVDKSALAKKKQLMMKQHMLDKQRLQLQQQGKIPTGHMESVDHLDELNRYEKETGKDYKTGKEVKSGGSSDKAFTTVKKMIRGMEGTPAGQRKKQPGKKPPVAGQYGAPKSPAQKVAAKRAAAKRAQDNMSSRFD